MRAGYHAFQAALCLWLLLFVSLLWGACGGPADVIVSLADWPAGAERLRVRTTLNGQAGSEQYVSRDSKRFVIRLPEGTRGTLQIELLALDGNGCKTATGSVTQEVPAGLRGFVEISPPLASHTPPLCTVSVVVKNGSGSVVSQPAAISCRDGAAAGCSADVGLGTSLLLQATPGRRSFGGTWGGACTGSQPCTLTVNRPQDVSIYFTTAACSVDAWCWYNPLPTGNSLNGVWGSSASDVWAVGGQGTLLHYDGIAWNGLQSVTARDLFAIWGSAASDVWAVGDAGTVLHFDGQSWSVTDLGLANQLRGIWGSGPSDVWAVGSSGKLLHWNGTQWLSVDVGTSASLNAIWGSDANNIWVAGDNNTNLRFDGVRWSPFSLPATINAAALFGTSATEVWAAGSNLLLRYNGATWSSLGSPSGASIRGLFSKEAGRLWIAGGYEASGYTYGYIHSWNGSTFSTAVNGQRPNFNAIWGASANDIWAVGGYPGQFESAGIWHWDGLKWTSLYTPLAGRIVLRDARPISASELWAVGDMGTTLAWDGRAVRSVASGTTQTLTKLWPISPTDIWAVTGSSNILRWDGSAWNTAYGAGSGYYWTDVWGAAPNSLWFAGTYYNSTANMYTAYALLWNGSSYSMQTVASSRFLTAIHGRSATDVWLVGYSTGGTYAPVAYRYNGSFWAAVGVTGGPSNVLNGVWAGGSQEAWAVGTAGGLYELQGGVLNARTSGTNISLQAIDGISAAELWTVGSTGTILRRSGSAWNTVQSGTVRELMRITPVGANDAWAAGWYGTLLRYQP